MYVCNTFFKKKPNKKWTWISPNSLVRNEIDFILSNNINVVTDTSVISNFEFHSDHRLVRATLNLKIKQKRHFTHDDSVTKYQKNLESVLKTFSLSCSEFQKKYDLVQNTILREANTY